MLCLKNMRLLLFVLITLTLLTISVSAAVAAEKVDTLYFSISVPDTWTYETSFNRITLVPAEFGDFFVLGQNESKTDKMELGGALAGFGQDTGYSLKNAPLETYLKYVTTNKNDALVLSSQEDATIDGEEAVRINLNGTGEFGSFNYVQYYTLHDKDPYFMSYQANKKDFEKFLPDFEQMVKSFRFEN